MEQGLWTHIILNVDEPNKTVSRVADIIQGWNNPFTDSQQELVCISSTKALSKEVVTNFRLEKAYEISEKCDDRFKKKRIERGGNFISL